MPFSCLVFCKTHKIDGANGLHVNHECFYVFITIFWAKEHFTLFVRYFSWVCQVIFDLNILSSSLSLQNAALSFCRFLRLPSVLWSLRPSDAFWFLSPFDCWICSISAVGPGYTFMPTDFSFSPLFLFGC